jgi:hypothetical protein
LEALTRESRQEKEERERERERITSQSPQVSERRLIHWSIFPTVIHFAHVGELWLFGIIALIFFILKILFLYDISI